MDYSRGTRDHHADEIDQTRTQIDKKTDESLAATRRIKQIAVETERTGADALITLHEQGEQLDNVEENLEDIDSALKRTDRELTELEKCCGICRLPGSRVKSYQKAKNYKTAYGAKARKQEMVSNQPGSYGATGNVVTSQPKGPIINRVTNDVREDEMDANLQDVNTLLDNMKNIAGDMGGELDRQNDQLGRLEKKMVANDEHIRVANYRVAKQMN